ncbi:UDP-glucosyltransferase 2-like [Sitodiplosis mosellana]|uniref:UDP-glucosyltransferase 2-like n=1 Tax=Sitodiplosis mosellana TaxID=263140 RepID=UPI0024439D9C|nr:UDP-glucosyltransferase 2-like [Sitodiplosis mosellana]XP_055313329.1 UDP-glucosyltransferase 2-like [Sitodiplosis mosellana]XP_055313330.1 UDP-glucosyltransferase 2-like [Sitodiplosis mosellana]
MFSLRALVLLALTVFCANVNGANILACVPSASRSHHIVVATILEELANRGHNVTVLSTFPKPDRPLPKTYHHIYTQIDDLNEWIDMRKGMLNNETKDDETQMKRIPKWMRMMAHRSTLIIKHEAVQSVIKSGQKFDLFFFDYSLNDMMLGLAGHFRCPSVVFSTSPAMKPLRDMIGNPAAVSSAPLFKHLKKIDQLNFKQRLGLFIEYVFEYFYVSYVNYFLFEKFYDEHFGVIENFPTFDEIKKNVSLILTTTHFSEGTIRPALPNLIEVGGLHIKETPNPLPKEFQDVFDSADENGVIVFSFGGNIQSSHMTDDKVKLFYSVFAQLKQKIIWKWESSEIPVGKPKNVHMMQWIPQADLFAQPQVRFFISHCGISGIYEAKFYGVPILGIPIYGDQLANAKQIENQGWAVTLDFDTLNKTIFSESIHEILTNSTYRESVQKLSQLFRDRPMSPLQTAVYWIEYVIRYDGAKHMQSSAVHLNFIQKNSLDVIFLFVVVFYILFKILAKLVSLVIKYRPLWIVTIAVLAYLIFPFVKSE